MKTTKKLKLSFNKFRVVIFEQGVESPNNSTYFFKKSVYTEFEIKALFSLSFYHFNISLPDTVVGNIIAMEYYRLKKNHNYLV
jgi:hypothetical protein